MTADKIVNLKKKMAGISKVKAHSAESSAFLSMEWRKQKISKIPHVYLIFSTQVEAKFEHLTELYLIGNIIHNICS